MNTFRRLCLTTLLAVYVLILVGGIVRTTGSGMGCPDWPKCFGSWAPPASADQLPGNYKSVYAAAREKKNIKFAKYLKVFGFKATADEILNDQSIQTETEFNVNKAWIEYGNRLIGVVIGFLIVGLFAQSRKFRKSKPSIFYLSFATLIAVIIQGWFGSIVVSTNLTTWTITAHMFFALLIVGLIVRLLILSSPPSIVQTSFFIRMILLSCMIVLLIQTLLGTNVRSVIDVIANQLPRSEWIDAIGMKFFIHRTFSVVVVVLHVILLMKIDKTMASKALLRALIVIILGAFLTGIGMAWFSMPAWLQPLHLLLATSAFGIQLYLFFQWSSKPKAVLTN